MPVQDDIIRAVEGFGGAVLPKNTLDRRIALGIGQFGPEGHDAWVIVGVEDNRAQVVDIQFCAPLDDADAQLGVDVAVIAELAVWNDISLYGHAGAVKAAEEQRFVVTGKLAFFIRNLRSILDLMVTFAVPLAVLKKIP